MCKAKAGAEFEEWTQILNIVMVGPNEIAAVVLAAVDEPCLV